MPIQSCILPNGKKGYKYGTKGKCYASRKKAEEQAAAIHASGFNEEKSKNKVDLKNILRNKKGEKS